MNNWKKVIKAEVPMQEDRLICRKMKIHLTNGSVHEFLRDSIVDARESFLIIQGPNDYKEQETGEYTNVRALMYKDILLVEWSE